MHKYKKTNLVLVLTVLIIVFFQNFVKAEIIKWTNCKTIEDPFSESLWKKLQETQETKIPFDKEKWLKNENEKYEYINRTFDTKKKILTYERKEKGEELFIKKSSFEIKDENTFTIVKQHEYLYKPKYNKETKKIESDETSVAVAYVIYNLIDSTMTYFDYRGSGRTLEKIQQCESNYSSNTGETNDTASSGTAFFINNRGNLITNNHVVEGCKLSKINYFNKEYETNLISTDKTLDLALLKVDLKPKEFISFSKKEPRKRQLVIVAGYPLGEYLSDDLKINEGKISSLKGFENNSNEITVDLAINPGNSGGPIVDENGQLVAVAVAGMSKEVTEGISFGIKSFAVSNFLKTNKISPETNLTSFSMNDEKVNQLLEESTVYIFCE
tara:strand:+ start:492 stop:1646 length:1155 start_codon:yes stop_codon:yes gene_type:complete